MPSANGKRHVILHPSIGLFTFENRLSFVFYFYLLSSSYPAVDKKRIDERKINSQFRRHLSVNTLRNVWHQEEVRARCRTRAHCLLCSLHSSFNVPNFPCCDKTDQISLKKHLMYKHNLSNTAGTHADVLRDNVHFLSRL